MFMRALNISDLGKGDIIEFFFDSDNADYCQVRKDKKTGRLIYELIVGPMEIAEVYEVSEHDYLAFCEQLQGVTFVPDEELNDEVES